MVKSCQRIPISRGHFETWRVLSTRRTGDVFSAVRVATGGDTVRRWHAYDANNWLACHHHTEIASVVPPATSTLPFLSKGSTSPACRNCLSITPSKRWEWRSVRGDVLMFVTLEA